MTKGETDAVVGVVIAALEALEENLKDKAYYREGDLHEALYHAGEATRLTADSLRAAVEEDE